MIGGFDQLHFFTGCDEDATRAEVQRCFNEAGEVDVLSFVLLTTSLTPEFHC